MMYRKRPVVIEAFQVTRAHFGRSVGQWPAWARGAISVAGGAGTIQLVDSDGVACTVRTLEDVMECHFNDWLILGTEGEIYPCKPSVFAATYEEVED